MKNKTNFNLIIGLVIIFSSLACKKQLEKGIPLNQLTSVTKSISENAQFHTGSVQIITSGNNDLVIGIREFNDQDHEVVYLLQRSSSEPKISLNINNAEVVYLLHGLLINSLDKKERYYFSVEKQEERDIFNQLPFEYKQFFNLKSQGFGLVRFFDKISKLDAKAISKVNSIDFLSNEFKKHKQDALLTQSASCLAGGAGATSCSISGTGGCSVSCSSGYYACCNINSSVCNSKPIRE